MRRPVVGSWVPNSWIFVFALGKPHDVVLDKYGLGAVVHMGICGLITPSSLGGTRRTLHVMEERLCFPLSISAAAKDGTTVAELVDFTVAWIVPQTGQAPQCVRSDQDAGFQNSARNDMCKVHSIATEFPTRLCHGRTASWDVSIARWGTCPVPGLLAVACRCA